jgi:hypothetical protein
VWLEGKSTIAPAEKKRKIVASKNLVPFQAQETHFRLNDQEHIFTKAGCWLTAETYTNFAISPWKQGLRKTGWLGEGSVKFALCVSVALVYDCLNI